MKKYFLLVLFMGLTTLVINARVPQAPIKDAPVSEVVDTFVSDSIHTYVTIDNIVYVIPTDSTVTTATLVKVVKTDIPTIIDIDTIVYSERKYSVVEVSDRAFYGCTNLTTIRFPQTITKLGTSILGNCPLLDSITIAEGNTIYDSRNNCNAIIVKTTDSLLIGCQKTLIPGSVKKIAASAFTDCVNLKRIVIPEGVVGIGDFAFYNCTALTEVTIAKTVKRIGSGVFFNCKNLTTINCEAIVPPTLGDAVFTNTATALIVNVPIQQRKAYDAWVLMIYGSHIKGK